MRYPAPLLLAKTAFPLAMMLLAAISTGVAEAQIVIDFEDENYDVWEFVDEDIENLGDIGPSNWIIQESLLGFDNLVLWQGSNIWGEPEDHMLMGTIAYYSPAQFTNFRLEVDVASSDNDGMGLVWGYQDLDDHYRFQVMNDRWPEVPPLDGYNGPYLIAHERISNSSPWYEVLGVIESDEYIPYTQGAGEINHWILEVVDGTATITTIDSFGDENSLVVTMPEYQGGYVGIQLYAQTDVEFDNFTITPLDDTVEGDFDGSGALDAADIDDLTVQVAGGTNPAAYDLNGDSAVNAADMTVWIKDLYNSWIGDANLDGQFNSSDLVAVLSSGTYEANVDSTWSSGDFNGDRRTNSGDLVAALSDGGYEAGPRAAVQAVPEPTGAALSAAALAMLMVLRRR
jgi:hypothetical protein